MVRKLFQEPVRVYVPKAGSRAEDAIDDRSAIVGTPASDWLEHGGPEDIVVLDFEGARYSQFNMRTFADRCLHAAGRHVQHYPTVARLLVDEGEVTAIGSFDGRAVMVDDHEALAAWLGGEALDEDELVLSLG